MTLSGKPFNDYDALLVDDPSVARLYLPQINQMARVCHCRDEEFGPECGKDSTRRDESGNTYCDLHDYIAAIAGEITFPIDASPFEMARAKAAMHEVAYALRDELMAEDHEIDRQLDGRWEK